MYGDGSDLWDNDQSELAQLEAETWEAHVTRQAEAALAWEAEMTDKDVEALMIDAREVTPRDAWRSMSRLWRTALVLAVVAMVAVIVAMVVAILVNTAHPIVWIERLTLVIMGAVGGLLIGARL